MKIRVRFGIRLPWFLARWGVFVTYLTQENFDAAVGYLAQLKAVVPPADALFIERG